MEHQFFRKLGEGQIEEMVTMMREFYAIDQYPFDEDLTRSNFHQFVQNPDLGSAFVMYNEGNEVIGYVILTYIFSFEFGGRIAFLDELFLNEKARGKGYGKLAVDFVKDFAKDQGLKVVMLEIERHNKNALLLYLNKGFKEHYRNLMIYSPQN